jgi:hypothetical protein
LDIFGEIFGSNNISKPPHKEVKKHTTKIVISFVERPKITDVPPKNRVR